MVHKRAKNPIEFWDMGVARLASTLGFQRFSGEDDIPASVSEDVNAALEEIHDNLWEDAFDFIIRAYYHLLTKDRRAHFHGYIGGYPVSVYMYSDKGYSKRWGEIAQGHTSVCHGFIVGEKGLYLQIRGVQIHVRHWKNVGLLEFFSVIAHETGHVIDLLDFYGVDIPFHFWNLPSDMNIEKHGKIQELPFFVWRELYACRFSYMMFLEAIDSGEPFGSFWATLPKEEIVEVGWDTENEVFSSYLDELIERLAGEARETNPEGEVCEQLTLPYPNVDKIRSRQR